MTSPLRFALAALALLLFLGGPSLLRFYTDWLWFGEVGYQTVFLTIFRSQGTLFSLTFIVATAWLVLNLNVALSAIGNVRPVFTTREGIQVTLPGGQQLRTLARGAAVLLAALIGLFFSGRWEEWLTWRYGVPFGVQDPILGRDVAFYVYSLPFLRLVQRGSQTLVVLAALSSAAIYLVSGHLTSGFPSRLSVSPSARRHLILLAGTFFLLLAWGAWLQRTEHLIESSGLIHGASYADVYGRMPAALLLMAVAVIGAALAAWQAFDSRNWPIPLAIGLYLLVSIGGEVYSSVLQRFIVTPNEQVRETPFIEHNIAATRRAFGLETVEERPLSGDALLTRADITNNAATLENVRLWDHQPLLETFGQIQEIRTYYDFVSVDNDRYRINGALRQVMLSARELNSASLPNRTWVNERLTFTHGYGLTLGPVNQVTTEGLPVLFVRDLPPQSTVDLKVDEPSIYFGELTNDYVIVRTRTREFHYPRGDENEFTQYAGTGGVSLGSFWRKLLFALRFGSYQIILTDDIGPESKILFNRNIRERITRLAPFLRFLDLDPYLVVADGRLFWLYDAYTASTFYPYSTPAGQVNYIRNSVKFVIDAYNGTTTAYLADPDDPIAATYARIFPDTFKPLDEMPASIRSHVRYPEDIFAVQAQVFATYHMTQPAVFYNREDQWEVPSVDDGSENRAMQPYYTIMRLPGESEAEFIQMLPFTPRRRDNLAAWLVARSDGEHYGKMFVFEFPKQKLVFGPRQVVARISQDQVISPQITLWNQQGSQVIWGTLMVIPIEESLIYVRPLYLRASGGRIPELTRVIVAYENRIVMQETLEAGLAELFGGKPASPSTSTSTAAPAPGPPAADGTRPAATGPDLSALAAQAQAHYERAVTAQRSGDWATYGEELRQLGQVLDKMRAR
ncbi:MAG TPA: UPF0182 family protein [Vicinamibacterales bacterium]|nr:UPF0182 family protein [Vicinamibacterales bacterium]